MTEEKLFGTCIRCIGLILFLYSLSYLLYGIFAILSISTLAKRYSAEYFLSGIPYLLVSLYLLKGAPLIFKYCYGSKE